MNSSAQSPSGRDQRWDYPHPHILFTQVQAGDIDGLQHTNNAVYVDWCQRAAWDHSVALRLYRDQQRPAQAAATGIYRRLWSGGAACSTLPLKHWSRNAAYCTTCTIHEQDQCRLALDRLA